MTGSGKMFSFFSLKALLLFLLLLLVVGCTIFTMQGMLPSNDPDVLDRIDIADSVVNPDGAKVRGGLHSKMSDSVATSFILADLTAEKLETSVDVRSKDVKLTLNEVQVMGRNVSYREALPPDSVTPTNQNAVLLHGMSFKSQTWENLTTIGLLAAMGHRVVAFDLPGYGETGGEQIAEDKRGEFLNEALTALKLTDPVVVSPSMSGTYSLPYLFKYPGKMAGFVPVAPVGTEKYSKEDYEAVKTPTLIIYGERDETLGELSTKNLKHIPNSQVKMLEGAGHPAYLHKPKTFHTLLYNFFLILRGK